MKICSTGFSKIDLLHLSKLATLAGESIAMQDRVNTL